MALVLDYDRLLADYRASLGARLRGFRASDDAPPFLETWVPGEDDTESLDALFDAASSAGDARELRLRFGADTLARTPREELLRIAGRHGDVAATADGDAFDVVVRLSERKSGAEAGGPATTPRRARAVADRSFTVDPAITAAYDAALAAVPIAHEGPLDDATVSAEAERDGVAIAVSVDRETHVVERARHRGARDSLRAVLELLCVHGEGAPISELSEHAIIRVEHALRGRGGVRAVPGILTPDNADPRLRCAADLARELGRAYWRTAGATPPVRNEWEPPPSKEWQALDAAARVARVQTKLDAIAPGKASCLRIDKDTKVIVALARELAPSEKPALLMAIEQALRDSVEPMLGVWLEEVTDLNRIRRLAKDEGAR